MLLILIIAFLSTIGFYRQAKLVGVHPGQAASIPFIAAMLMLGFAFIAGMVMDHGFCLVDGYGDTAAWVKSASDLFVVAAYAFFIKRNWAKLQQPSLEATPLEGRTKVVAPTAHWQTPAMLVVLLLMFGLGLVFKATTINPNSEASKRQNIEFMREQLGAIVLQYLQKHGHAPEQFETALQESDKTLPNRGDYFGRSLVYERLADDAFRFVAFGANNDYDDGDGDDVVVEYFAGQWFDNLSNPSEDSADPLIP